MCRPLLALLLAAPVLAQSTPPSLAQALAAKIASAIVPAEPIQLTMTEPDSAMAADLARFLDAGGIRTASGAAIAVRVECLDNLREQSCVADIKKGDSRRIVALTRSRESAPASREPMIALELRPLLARRDPILDLSIVGDQLIVLTPDRIALHPGADRSAVADESVPSRTLTTSRVWPRDLRGRLIANADGFTAYLPGVTCRGTLTPFAVTCADEGEPWPIGIENNGVIARRNYFLTPEGLTFYNAARLGTAADARWIAVDERGSLMFLNDRRQPQPRSEAADDVVALQGGCGPTTFVVMATSSADNRWADTVRLLRLVDDRLVPAAAPLTLPGALTALWAAPGASVATAVIHQRFMSDANAGAITSTSEVGRYEAFQLSLSCTR